MKTLNFCWFEKKFAWMVKCIEGPEKEKLFCYHVLRETDKWDIFSLFKNVKEFLHTENYKMYGQKLEKFYSSSPKQNEDIFSYISRIAHQQEKRRHLCSMPRLYTHGGPRPLLLRTTLNKQLHTTTPTDSHSTKIYNHRKTPTLPRCVWILPTWCVKIEQGATLHIFPYTNSWGGVWDWGGETKCVPQ